MALNLCPKCAHDFPKVDCVVSEAPQHVVDERLYYLHWVLRHSSATQPRLQLDSVSQYVEKRWILLIAWMVSSCPECFAEETAEFHHRFQMIWMQYASEVSFGVPPSRRTTLDVNEDHRRTP